MIISIDEVIGYCKLYDRICPMPEYWNKLFQMLKNTRQNPNGGWEPPLPLILAAWHDTPALPKMMRLYEHVKWAEKEGQLEEIFTFLKNLKEENWFHLNE